MKPSTCLMLRATTGSSDTELDGTTAYVVTGTAVLAVDGSGRATGGAPVITRVTTGNSPFSTTAGRRAVTYVVVADGVTVGGVAVPANTGHTFWSPDADQPAITFTADATGDVLVIQEAA